LDEDTEASPDDRREAAMRAFLIVLALVLFTAMMIVSMVGVVVRILTESPTPL
jgi:hypothetical protein